MASLSSWFLGRCDPRTCKFMAAATSDGRPGDVCYAINVKSYAEFLSTTFRVTGRGVGHNPWMVLGLA